MKLNKNYAVFILSHGRPDNVITYQTLRKCGYTGRIFIIVDDEDKMVYCFNTCSVDHMKDLFVKGGKLPIKPVI